MRKRVPIRQNPSSARQALIIMLVLVFLTLLTSALAASRKIKKKINPPAFSDQVFSPDPAGSSSKPATQSNPLRADIRSYLPMKLDKNAVSAILQTAPMEFSDASGPARSVLTLPIPDGSFIRFAIAESPIMAPELAARFPEIKTYVGQGLDYPTTRTRFDLTPQGFHAIVLSDRGTVLIEPAAPNDMENYVVYFQKDVVADSFECDVTAADQEAEIARRPVSEFANQVKPAVISGTTLRGYRLAVAATAEYTQTYGGGTVNGALAAITTTINLVDAIYESEVSVRLILIAGETSIIFTDTATDGYTSDNVNSLFNENQTKLDTVIGSANYDIGHVFDGHTLNGGAFSWQGVAAIGSVCVTGAKARGVDIFRSIGPSVLYAYYSASHEMGHQFGATHTFNANTGLCASQRTPSSAYEPSSGSTIMGYRLACSPDDLNSTDTYFHNNSIEQIVNYISAANGGSCATTSPTGNNAPLVDAEPSYTIPIGTPFTLTATGLDPDGDSLTFCWEEFDLGTVAPPDTDDGSRPIFRSFAPTTNPTRTFPRLADVLSGGSTMGESMPSTTRVMNFRVTARDNRAGGGGVNSAATQVTSNIGAGPFTVTQPAAANTWPTGSIQTVAWNVANTNLSPVSCTNVKITLSTDGGTTFAIVLANNTPNDGSELVTIPGTPGSNARIKVAAIGNVFFNISRSFTITGSANIIPAITNVSPGSGAVGSQVTINGANFINPSSVSFNGVPATFTLSSTAQIVATIPATANTGRITVTTPSGTAISPSNFTVNVTAVKFSASSYQVSEAGPDDTITVIRTGDTSGPSTVDYATSDTASSDCSVANGAASSHCDYLATLGTVRFAANETSKTISIPIIDDAYVEGSESFTITLSNSGFAALDSPATATITIADNDSVAGQNPIEQAGPFVREQYIDFLNREPDQSGLNFWTNEITSCGSDLQCSETKRITVSAAFYLSIEFQDTGYLVERMYKAAFGSAMGNSTFNGTHQISVPIVRFNEFLPDTQRIAQGVVVGAPDWETVLESNKQAFALEFVQRPRFASAFPASLTPDQFVDQLFDNAGVTPSASDRNTAMAEFGLVTNTSDVSARSRALRRVAENSLLNTNELNRAFVLMQYFGYLRRNPDDAPDADYSGFDFWLTKLNQFNGNFVQAEMVKAFISASEYRQRFGP